MPKKRSLCQLLVILALAGLLSAQEENQGEEASTFSGLIEVSEVLLDVLATDLDGKPIVGLKAEDFIVEEEGQPVTVTSVSYYTTRYNLEDPLPGATREIPASRYFILFFHDQSRFGYYGQTLLRQQFEAGRQSIRWIEEEMRPSDWVAVLSYDVKLGIYQDFTQDKEALAEAVRLAISGKNPSAFKPRRRRAGEELSILRRLPPDRELRRQTANVYDGLRAVAEVTGAIVGRKNLMLYTIGFGERLGASRLSRPDPRYYPALEAALNDHNVAVYPVDLTPPGREPLQDDFLHQLAVDTGGYYYEDFVGFLAPLQQTSEENHGYYLLSYQTEHPAGEVGYQKVEVKARDQGILVRARTGYRFGL